MLLEDGVEQWSGQLRRVMAMVSRRVRAVVGIIEASDGGKGDVVLDQLATLTALLSSSFQCWWWLICSCIGVKATTSCPSGGHVCAVWWTLLPCTFVHRWLAAAPPSCPHRHCRPFRGIEDQRVGGGGRRRRPAEITELEKHVKVQACVTLTRLRAWIH